MKILHAGWAFQPYRRGGLIEYAEDLMEIQAQNGYNVHYFCTGRGSLFLKKPVVKKWTNKKGFQVYELLNPPIISGLDLGIREPLLDISEKITEKVFLEIVQQLKPDVVHFQEFLGIPTAIIRHLKKLAIPVVFTVEDYFVLCPTLKLIKKSDGKLCRIKGQELGRECANCCRLAPGNNKLYKFQSMFNLFDNRYWLKTKIFLYSGYRFLKRIKNSIPDNQSSISLQRIEEYNQRRAANLENLQNCDLIIAMSNKVATILHYYAEFKNLIVLNLTLKHLSHIIPYEISIKANQKIRLGLINVMASVLKGKELMFELFEKIRLTKTEEKVEFVILGDLDEDSRKKLSEYSFIRYKGRFKAENLNGLLESLKIDIGLVPSVWEEAYGYVGVEFMAKGIPVIGNNVGGIVDYLIDGETGWLNHSSTSGELLEIINRIILNPKDIERINKNLITNRTRHIKDIQHHFFEMDIIYKKLLQSTATG